MLGYAYEYVHFLKKFFNIYSVCTAGATIRQTKQLPRVQDKGGEGCKNGHKRKSVGQKGGYIHFLKTFQSGKISREKRKKYLQDSIYIIALGALDEPFNPGHGKVSHRHWGMYCLIRASF